MRADEERALRSRPANDLLRPLEDVLGSEALLELAPDVDALDQRARLVESRPAGRERRVEMEMTVDERRGDEPAGRIELDVGNELELGSDARPAAAVGGEIDERVAVERPRVSDHEVGHRASFRSTPTSAPIASSQPLRTEASSRRPTSNAS